MIVVVEGPSGAGKTTWCIRHGGPHALLEALPDHASIPTERRPTRASGSSALDAVEDRTHERIRVADAARRRARSVRCGRYTLADAFLVSDIDTATLRARRDADATRTRRNFETHLVLRDSLRSWYESIDALEPGRVHFGLPEGGVPRELIALGPRRVRSGAVLFDRLLTFLPD